MPCRFFVSAFVVLFVALLVAAPVRAGVEVEVADAEKPVFAFFKLAQHAPDFKYWAQSMPLSADLKSEADVALFFEQEATRLQWAFGTFDEKSEFLPLRVPVDLTLVEKEGGHFIHYNLVGFDEAEMPFFPFPYGGQAVGLVVKDLERFNGIELSASDYARMGGYFNAATPLRASLRLRVRPLEADATAPVVVDGVNFWVLAGDVGYFSYELKSSQGEGYERIMSYSAPWFMTQSELDLFEMLGE